MVLKNLAVILVISLLVGCVTRTAETGPSKTDIDLRTEDGIRLKATFYNASGPNGVMLLHMLGNNRSSWEPFASELQRSGYKVLAVDMRGHGQSELRWQTFSDDFFNRMALDAKEAKNYLASNGAKSLAIIGASIGANIALNYGLNDSSVKTVILLSPGLDYKGVMTEESAGKFNKPLLTAAAIGDEYSAKSAERINALASGKKKLKMYDGSRHGTELFKEENLDTLILDWLEGNLK